MIILEDDLYRAHPAANFSSIKAILQSPKHYQAALAAPRRDPSPAMQIGLALHSSVLENDASKYIVKPDDVDFRTSAGKAWREAHKNNVIMSADDYAAFKRMEKTVATNADIQYLLKMCPHREIGIVNNYRGVEIKGKIDAYGKDESGKYFIFDLKSSSDASPEGFAKSVCSFKYAMQRAWYAALLALELSLDYVPPWYWVTVENSEAADACIYQPSAEMTEVGQRQMDEVIDKYKECTSTGRWPGYGSGILTLELPAWESRKYLN